MAIVNVVMMIGMAMFVTEAMLWLVPMVLEEFKDMED